VPRPVVMTSRAASHPRPGSDIASGTSALDRLARRLRALSPDDPELYTVTDLSGGLGRTSSRSGLTPGWIPVAEAVPAMLACAGDHLAFSPAVAGARMIGSLGYAVAGRLSVALAVTGQAFDVGPDSLAVRLDEAGLIERVGIRSPALAVAVTQGPDELPGVIRLAELGDVIAWAADRAWATLDPLIDELHELTRYGRVPMWNLVADSVLGPATTAPHRADLDQRTGRAIGSAFLDALVERGAPIHRRGTVRPADAPGSPTTLELTPVRGSCCLYFRQSQKKCASCPLLA
jgi:FhuF-like iron-sulfur protein